MTTRPNLSNPFVALAQAHHRAGYTRAARREIMSDDEILYHATASLVDGVRLRGTQPFGAASGLEVLYRLSQWRARLTPAQRAALDRLMSERKVKR